MSSGCNISYLADELEPRICASDRWLLLLNAVFLGVVVLCSFIANSLVLLLVIKYKKLRYRSIMVSLSGVVTDLLMTLFFHFPALVSASKGEWAFGQAGCWVLGQFSFYLAYVRWMTMGVIALDRFSYILFPLSYNSWSKPYLIILIISTWCVPVFMQLPSMVGVGTFTYRPGFSQCLLDCGNDYMCQVMNLVVFSIQYSIGVIVPIGLYTAIAFISRCKKKRIQLGLQLSADAERAATVRNRLTNMVPWTKKDTRIILIFALILVCLFITTTPAYFIVIFRRTTPTTYRQIPLWAHMLMANLFYLSNVLNPLLLMQNQDIKKAIFQLFCKRPPRAYRSASLSTLRRPSVCQPGNSINNNP